MLIVDNLYHKKVASVAAILHALIPRSEQFPGFGRLGYGSLHRPVLWERLVRMKNPGRCISIEFLVVWPSISTAGFLSNIWFADVCGILSQS